MVLDEKKLRELGFDVLQAISEATAEPEVEDRSAVEVVETADPFWSNAGHAEKKERGEAWWRKS